MNLPNKLTILRICMIPLFIAAYFLPFAWAPWLALGIFVLAAFTDFLDGHIARKYNLVTDLGKLLDPIADKILVAAALFCLVATNPMKNLVYYHWDAQTLTYGMDAVMSRHADVIGGWTTFTTVFLPVCATLIIGRELLIDAVRMIAASKGVVVQANIFGKIKTVLQDVSLPLMVAFCACCNYAVCGDFDRKLRYSLGIIAMVLFCCATVMTVVSGVIYLVQNRNVFASKKEQPQQ